MEVRMVEVPKKVEKREVPFVVGGVYCFLGDYLLLTQRGSEGGDYMLIWLDGGRWDRPTGKFQSKKDVETLLSMNECEYVPGAYLAIPKEVE